MKKIIFVVVISIQTISTINSMQKEQTSLNDVPAEVLYYQFQETMLSEIANATTLTELDRAYKSSLEKFARLNKYYAGIVETIKQNEKVKKAYESKYLPFVEEKILSDMYKAKTLVELDQARKSMSKYNAALMSKIDNKKIHDVYENKRKEIWETQKREFYKNWPKS